MLDLSNVEKFNYLPPCSKDGDKALALSYDENFGKYGDIREVFQVLVHKIGDRPLLQDVVVNIIDDMSKITDDHYINLTFVAHAATLVGCVLLMIDRELELKELVSGPTTL